MSDIMSDVVPAIYFGDVGRSMSREDLGKGFKLNVGTDEDAVRSHIFKVKNSNVLVHPMKDSDFSKAVVLDCDSSIREHMQLDGCLSVAFGPLKSVSRPHEPGGTYLSSSISTRRKAVLRYTSRHTHSYAHIQPTNGQPMEPTDEVAALARASLEDGITKLYGTKFIEQVMYGCQLDIRFEVTSSADTDLTKIMEELKASITSDAAVHTDLSSNGLHIQISAQTVGMPSPIANPEKLQVSQVPDLIKHFNSTWRGRVPAEESKMAVVAFALAPIHKHLPLLQADKTTTLDERMSQLSQVLLSAALWKLRLQAAKAEREDVYTSERERKLVLAPFQAGVDKELCTLSAKLDKCNAYCRLSLAQIVSHEAADVQMPEVYPDETRMNVLRGYVGTGSLPAPVRLWRDASEANYDYKGFLLTDGGTSRPWMSGMLLGRGGDSVVAKGRTPENLFVQASLKGYVMDRKRLRTCLMENISAPDYDARSGDIFVTRSTEALISSHGDFDLKLAGKRLVLTGTQGSGKSSLYKRLTGDIGRSEFQAGGATTSIVSADGVGPAKHLRIVDTPGMTAETDFHEVMGVHKGLTSGETDAIVMVAEMPVGGRSGVIKDAIQGARLHDIMGCNTFRQDTTGTDVTIGDAYSPYRTQVFLVLTKRDHYLQECQRNAVQSAQYHAICQDLCRAFPFIAGVAFIDLDVSVSWLYDTLVAFAAYPKPWNINYTIPLVEVFYNFPILLQKPAHPSLDDIRASAINQVKVGCMAIHHRIQQAEQDRQGQPMTGSSSVDLLSVTLDKCILFLDDQLEAAEKDAVAKLCNCAVNELFMEFDTEECNRRVGYFNYFKRELAREVMPTRRDIIRRYPRGAHAIYKRCPNERCNLVYAKPVGCDQLGRCGQLQSGSMPLNPQYGYVYSVHDGRGELKIEPNRKDVFPGFDVFNVRRWFHQWYARVASTKHLIDDHDEDSNSHLAPCAEVGDRSRLPLTDRYRLSLMAELHAPFPSLWGRNQLGYRGCGRELRWNEMLTLTEEQMKELELDARTPGKPQLVPYDATVTIGQLLKDMDGIFVTYEAIFAYYGLTRVSELREFGGEEAISDLLQGGIPNNLPTQVPKKLAKLNARKILDRVNGIVY